MRRNNRGNRLAILAGTAALALTVTALTATAHGIVVYAAQEEEQTAPTDESEYILSKSGTSGRIRSNGRVQYEYAVIDGDDLRTIDAYISEKKDAAARALIRVGTRFRQQSGEYVYDRNPDAGQEDIDLGGLSWAALAQAAKESQNVPAGLSVLNPEAALHIEGVEERTDFYEAAIEDNLSVGKAAWVNGRLLLGNGADNDKAYRKGLADGGQGEVPDNLCPIYGARGSSIEIRHVHIGNMEQTEGTSGCYYNHYDTISNVLQCDIPLHYFEAIWYPEDNAWHGGYYTCSHHGGIYDSPGICGQDYVEYSAEWRHDVTCGLENVVYARLTIKAEDVEQASDMGQVSDTERAAEGIGRPSDQIRLKAVLEGRAGYGRLIWKGGDKLIWTDDKGNVLGTGSDLVVFEPGIYRCSINVSNTDIDKRTAEAAVIVSGLMMR